MNKRLSAALIPSVRLLALALALACSLSLAGCQKTLKGTDALVEKARAEIPIADAENTEIRYAGQCVQGDDALLWFISGNAYQAHSYLPMECTVVGEEEYAFVRTYRPVERGGRDIVALQWKRGLALLVNDPRCTAIRLSDGERARDFSIGERDYPYILYSETLPSQYQFFDAAGNELL
ncbi:hypothetical protein [Bittarella massiliensis (ex Durand et al. 2017)]|uniref:hypothetical protein n=1 Tax=Bittarella massiliensis (ex Durand et al. 2017) TaxID=1720313 RepID=UPI001AA0BC08|nr:hypothetical protein [Bittarella massiliensis (ex Durand et al. 2017)]MBO1679826.1 hypothetical protein [Bittarella massiliensis (ex Durand et al. 2017)]